MNQFVFEGVVADVLSEHFGEAVELVGVTLLRNGPLTIGEILRVANLSLLSFPREVSNPLTSFSASSVEGVSWKHVRDSLLALIHFGLVVLTSDNTYILQTDRVIRRLCFPIYLETTVLSLEEKVALETVLRRGRVARSALNAAATDSLLERKILLTVDSLTTTKRTKRDSIVITANIDTLHADLLGSLAATFVADQLGPTAGKLVSSLRAGPASVTELEGGNELIGSLMRLQQQGWVVKSATTGRVVNNKQMGKKDYFATLIDTASSDTVPVYTLHMGRIMDELQACVVLNLVRARLGPEGARVFAGALGRKLESHHLAEQCAIGREECLKHLHALAVEGICQIQEVPKVTGSLSAAGGVAAMMRAVSSSFWLYSVDPVSARLCTTTWIASTITNLRRRFRHEVFRQCRIEDRAGTISQAEETYLFRVHEAQDAIEAASISLVHSLCVLTHEHTSEASV